MWGAEPALSTLPSRGLPGSGILLNATCAKLFRTVYDPDTGKPRVVPEVVRSTNPSNGGRTYTFELKRTFRFDTGEPVTAQSFADAFNRNANKKLGLAGGTPHAGDHRGRRSHGGNGEDRLGRGAARRLPPPHPPEASRGRPRRSPDDAVLLPDLARDARDRPINRPDGSGPYHVVEHVFGRRIVLERNPYYPAVGAPPIPTASSGRSSPTSARKSGRPSRARTTSRRCSPGRSRSSATSSTSTA